jgi:hypothetical protein
MSELEIPAVPAGDEVVPPVEAAQVEAEQPEGETPEGEQPEGDEAERASRSKERRERRKAELAQLRQSEAEAQARAEEAQQRLHRMQEAAKALPQPKQDAYANFEEYQAALTAWHVAQAVDSRELRKIEEDARTQYAQVKAARDAQAQVDAQNWAAQALEAKSRYPDFDVVTSEDPAVKAIVNPLAPLIMQSDMAADVAYYLVKNPEIGRQIAALPQVQAARALGMLEAQLGSAPQVKTVSTAPPPVNPVRPKATATLDASKMSMDDYIAARKAGKIR